jgi:prolyl-tRNA editing enzyme YbaK/EbsC (Cys-tRNA(Pro) deacylase)
MSGAWPEPVERVASFLRAAGAEARLEELPAETPTAEKAAEAIGCPLEQIVKSVVLVLDTGAYALALVSGDRRVDAGKVAGVAAVERARVALPEEVKDATGFVPGAVAPFPLTRTSLVLADRALLSQPVVWVGAGSTHHMARLSPVELVRLTRAETVDVAREPAYHSQSDAEKKEH